MQSFILLGDIAFNGILSEEPNKNPERFKVIGPLLHRHDLVFANLEAPVKVDEIKNEYKNQTHCSLAEPTKQLLQLLNIGCVSLANNHIYDCKMSGLKATINILDELGILHTGAGWIQEHIKPAIIERYGYKIAFLAYVDKSTNPKTEYFPELLINYFDYDRVISDINPLKGKVNKLICSIHWGLDYSFSPTKTQVITARKLIDNGVDIIMGHHPHTFQPFEKYKHGYIFYSLGGLTYGDYIPDGKTQMHALPRRTKKTAIVSYSPNDNQIFFTPVKELPGNYIVADRRNYHKWSRRMWFWYKLKRSSKLFQWMIDFHETFLSRIYEYFFGYYQNPIKRLFQFSNIKKMKRLWNDLKKRTS